MKLRTFTSLSTCFILLASGNAGAATLLAGFNFNNNDSSTAPGTFNTTGTDEVYDATEFTISPATHGVLKNTATIDLSNLSGTMGGGGGNNWGTFAGTTVNRVDEDVSGGALAIQGTDNNDRFILISVSTIGYEEVSLTYATRGTGTGFDTHTWEYSIDGINYEPAATITGRTASSFSTQTVDLTSENALNNQPTAYFKLTFAGATTASGNNRIDNLQITAVPEPTTALLGGLGLLALLRRRR